MNSANVEPAALATASLESAVLRSTAPGPVPLGPVRLGPVVLQTEALECRVGERRIIGPLDFSVSSGEIVSIVGPNGVGKSTLLAALSGDMKFAGSVTLLGQPIQGLSATELAKLRAVLLQDSSVSFPFRVGEVVEMGRAPWRRSDRAENDRDVVAKAMVSCDIAHLADRNIQMLSGGERARVALARTIAQETPVLLLDEPTAALDVHHQERTFELLRERAAHGVAVVVVVHDLGLAAAHSDRVVVLSDGLVAAEGAPETALDSEVLSRVYGHDVIVINHPQSPTPLVVPVRPMRSL
ncbi:MAG TPA: heme ABC transporter ATP-binding protein [Microthrixaceae bacterium]|nr:heme ABC transporter ATP-binding protein [Microthrixaceae bacterium]